MIDLAMLPADAKPIVKQVAEVYIEHTGDSFTGLIIHGSALKGDFIPGGSDIDFHLYLKEKLFHENGRLPIELILNIHRDLARIDPHLFRYIQCEA